VSKTSFTKCSGCPLRIGKASCKCLEDQLPSLDSGLTTGRHKELQYKPEYSESLSPETNPYSMINEYEAKTRLRKLLKKADLKPRDRDMFITRVLYKTTFTELADEFGFNSRQACCTQFNRIKKYLRGLLNGET
jgi:hypothetical protein